MSSDFDAIIIGGGHNGLVCAAYLARAGRKVLLLEANDRVGGASITRAFAPGYRVSAGAHWLHMLPKDLVADLQLERHGLCFPAVTLPSTVLSLEGLPIGLEGPGQPPAVDAAYPAFMGRLRRLAGALRPMLEGTPPRLGTRDWSDRFSLLRLAWQVRRLGRVDMRFLLRIIGMNVYDLAEEFVKTPALRGALGLDAVLGTRAGPRAPGTVLTLLYRLAGEVGALPAGLPKGGMGAVSDALAASAAASGAVLRTGARVARVVVENDRAVGVVLDNGEVLRAKRVISSADPRNSFLKLLGAAHLDTGFVRGVSRLRDKGNVAKLHLALSGLPRFKQLDAAALRGRLLIAPSLDYVERAYNPIKYGEFSQAPVLEITLPSLTDPDLAPAGQHVLSVIVPFAPFEPTLGWEAARAPFLESILATLESYAPGLRSLVLAQELLTPPDIAQEFNSTGGHWHQAELAFDQFYMVRPVPGAAQYSTPVRGFYLCGAGAHPGGGVMGLAGRNAARQILREAV